MSRLPAATPEQIRATVLAMLTEAGDAAPATGARFRQIVSVRKLRARLGAGDPATLARALNSIEAEVVRAGLADIAIPDIPTEIAEQMRALWQAAVAVQLDEVIRLKREAQDAITAAEAARTDAELRVELLRQEVTDLRTLLAARDAEFADLRAQHGVLATRCTELETTAQTRQAQLETATAERAALERAHADGLTQAQERYESLSRQLLQETAHQREAFKKDQAQLTSQLKFAERRIATLDAEHERLDGELAKERETRRQAIAESLAYQAVNASQHAQLEELMRVVASVEPARRASGPAAGLATAKRTRAKKA